MQCLIAQRHAFCNARTSCANAALELWYRVGLDSNSLCSSHSSTLVPCYPSILAVRGGCCQLTVASPPTLAGFSLVGAELSSDGDGTRDQVSGASAVQQIRYVSKMVRWVYEVRAAL